jgi:hypothetical protein
VKQTISHEKVVLAFAAFSGFLDRLNRGPKKSHRLHSADYFNTQTAVQNLDLQHFDNSQMQRKWW